MARRGFSNGVSFIGDEAGDIYVKKVLEIGDWNMDTTTSKSVSHNLTATEWKTITLCKVIIRNDADTGYYDIGSTTYSSTLGGVGGGWEMTSGCIDNINSSTIVLSVAPDSAFDTTNFNATSYNRGFIEILYIPD